MNHGVFRKLLCLPVSWCLLGGSVLAAGKSYQLTVDAGKHDRTNTPVCAVLAESQVQANLDPVILHDARSVELTDADGNRLPAQLTAPGLLCKAAGDNSLVARELHFVLPHLGKGRSMKLTARISDEAPPDRGFRWKDKSGEFAELSFGDRPVLRYMYKALDESSKQTRQQTYKVFHHLYDPAGTRFVTKGPGGLYTHHRGVFFGFNRVTYGDGRKCDTWHCGGGAHQSHEGFLADEAGPVLGRHRVAVHWHGARKEVFAEEQRELTVYNVPGGQLVEFASHLATADGRVRLDGDPQHAGFHFRAAQEVADGDQKLTYYLRPDGKGKPGATRNWPGNKDFINLPWNAMSFVIEGKRYTAAYLDSPANPKEARFSERSYGRFGSYFEYELDAETDLQVNYRIWLQDGEMTVEKVTALSNDFVDPVVVSVR